MITENRGQACCEQCCRSLLPSHLAIAAIPANPRGLLDARQYYNLHIYILHIGMSPYEQSSAPCRARKVRNQFVPIFRLIRFFFFVTGVLIKSHAVGVLIKSHTCEISLDLPAYGYIPFNTCTTHLHIVFHLRLFFVCNKRVD